MAVHANITRRAAIVGAIASAAVLSVPAVAAAKRPHAGAEAESLSNEALVLAVRDFFDSASFDRQQGFIRDLHSQGGLLAEIGDVFERRQRRQWEWVPTHIPGLSVPSNA